MESEQFRTRHATFSASSATCQPQTAAARAAILFGCYRRGDANDPDTYCAAIAAVLSRYSESVVGYVTDPRTGIPGSCEWLPSVAEVKAACIERQSYLDRLDDLDRRFAGRRPIAALPVDRSRPGRRANVFVHADAPQYQIMLERTKTADSADWKYDEQGRAGIWIALNLFHEYRPATGLKPYRAPSDDELRDHYASRETQVAAE